MAKAQREDPEAFAKDMDLLKSTLRGENSDGMVAAAMEQMTHSMTQVAAGGGGDKGGAPLQTSAAATITQMLGSLQLPAASLGASAGTVEEVKEEDKTA
jgi:hypothetical protein